jgi:hypothetical protein
MVKRILPLLLLVFTVCFFIGLGGKSVDASDCYFRCICSVPHKCCRVKGVETCKPVQVSPLQCPQVAC